MGSCIVKLCHSEVFLIFFKPQGIVDDVIHRRPLQSYTRLILSDCLKFLYIRGSYSGKKSIINKSQLCSVSFYISTEGKLPVVAVRFAPVL